MWQTNEHTYASATIICRSWHGVFAIFLGHFCKHTSLLRLRSVWARSKGAAAIMGMVLNRRRNLSNADRCLKFNRLTVCDWKCLFPMQSLKLYDLSVLDHNSVQLLSAIFVWHGYSFLMVIEMILFSVSLCLSTRLRTRNLFDHL